MSTKENLGKKYQYYELFGDALAPISEEEPLEDAEIDSDKVVTSEIPPLSGNAAQDYELFDKISDGVGRISEEDPLEDAENDLEKVLTSSGIPTLSGNADQILPLLKNLLVQNEIQRERLMGLIKLYDPTAAENRNPIVNAEGGQIATETDLSAVVQFLEQSVLKLEEELENQKKVNAQLKDEINRLTLSSDPEKND
ncbi:hypothetical protein AALP_AA5G179600 [Arabis alpina]|uniref:Uncharacterized protein n=1 Tax=Arabis alpina TaxID=50452 RepID=A0A087GXU4_ARAAL|nr:hypothetical protein AALP_AA5G179600 [Arabis alpina]